MTHSSASLKIQAGKDHIGRLRSSLDEHKSKIELREEFNASEQLFDVRLFAVDKFPASWAPMIGDALSNLRSALDHAVIASSLVGPHKQVAFPIVEDAPGLEKRLTQLEKYLPSHVVDCFREVNPTDNGNPPLAALNYFRNVDIHNYVVPVSTVAVSQAINGGFFQNARLIAGGAGNFEDGILIAKRQPEGKVIIDQLNMGFTVAFKDSARFYSGHQVLPALAEMASEAERVVLLVEQARAV